MSSLAVSLVREQVESPGRVDGPAVHELQAMFNALPYDAVGALRDVVTLARQMVDLVEVLVAAGGDGPREELASPLIRDAAELCGKLAASAAAMVTVAAAHNGDTVDQVLRGLEL